MKTLQLEKLPGTIKIAILFRVLGADFARQLSESMRPEEVTRVGEAMVNLEKKAPDPELVQAILGEFREMMAGGGGFANIAETLDTLFKQKFGEAEGKEILEDIRLNATADSSFEGMESIPHADVARILAEEHAGVQAAVLSNIAPQIAAGVLDCMEDDVRHGLLQRIATMNPPPPRLLRDMAEMFMAKVNALPRAADLSEDGKSPSIRRAADILNSTSPDPKQSILDRMEQDTPDLATELRETMFTFNDLASVEKKAMQQILGGIDTRLLALALKSCPEDIADAIFASVSQRTRDMIIEEKELLGAVPITEVQEAKKEIMLTIRGLMESGAVTVNAGGGNVEMVE